MWGVSTFLGRPGDWLYVGGGGTFLSSPGDMLDVGEGGTFLGSPGDWLDVESTLPTDERRIRGDSLNMFGKDKEDCNVKT